MKITRRQLRQIIKEEINLLLESPQDEYLKSLEAEVHTQIMNGLSQIVQNDDIEISDDGMDEISDGLSSGEWKVSRKDEESASLDWEAQTFRDDLITSGIPGEDVDQVLDDISFISAVNVQRGAFDSVFGEGGFDALAIGDMFSNVEELVNKISQSTKSPSNKKEYTGPKGKGQTRYIVTSQITKWRDDEVADYDSAVFFLVDTTDGTKFKVRGDELPYILPSTEGEVEIFDILPSTNNRESHLVADLNGKEFRLARKDI